MKKRPLIVPASEEARDLALGRFMSVWSEVEASLRRLLSALSGAAPSPAFAIAAAIPDLGRLRELLLVLGAMTADVAEQEQLKEICKRLQVAGMYRNYIVHGQWRTMTRISEEGGELIGRSEWLRVYVMIDPDRDADAISGYNKGDRDRYVFSIARLKERAQKAVQFTNQIDALTQQIKNRLEPRSVIRTPTGEPAPPRNRKKGDRVH